MSNIAPASEARFQCIALTPGEPAGIGPDIAIMLAQNAQPAAIVHFTDPDVVAARAEVLGVKLRIVELDSAAAARPSAAGVFQLVAVHAAQPVRAGQLNTANAAYVLECLDRASDACVAGQADALVTGPVNKAVINDAGLAFSGHTEYLANRLGSALPVMLLASSQLRVALLTTHVPLAAVPALVTAERIRTVVEIIRADLAARFGIAEPRIGICGLNPHAGEQGHLGSEERDCIEPAVLELQQRGIRIKGPLPADTLFTPQQRAHFDVILALYHDQGLTALKALSFGDAVNVTLGLPILRTSVDHGTALELAGTGKARSDSLRAALKLAIDLSAGAA